MLLQRKGVEELAREVSEGHNAVLVAPTGYGKSKSLPILLEETEKTGVATRAIHVLPLRALVRQQYLYLREVFGSNAGYLAGLSLDKEGYSPFMLRKAVVSTLDSFALNLARLPVAELPLLMTSYEMRRLEGHYELPRASIFTSLVVFDEAHLYAEPWLEEAPLSRLYLSTVLRVLRDTTTSVVIETATMATRLMRDVASVIGGPVLAVCRNCSPCSNEWRCIHDRVFEEENSFTWKTLILQGVQEAIDLAVSFAETGRKVLYTVNTVGAALSVYQELVSRLGEDSVVLVHGRLTQGDREKAIEGIGRARIVVATQVIEAGVDVDAEVLVTEAAAPSSLAQRAGRLCRSREKRETCLNEPPVVAVYAPETLQPYGDIALETLKSMKNLTSSGAGIEWRLLDDTNAGKSFRHLIEIHESTGLEPRRLGVRQLAYTRLLEYIVASALGDSSYARVLLRQFCSLVRETILIHLAVPVGEGYDFLEAQLDWLKTRDRWRALLDCTNSSCKVLAIGYGVGDAETMEATIEAKEVEEMLRDCSSYYKKYYSLLERLSKKVNMRLNNLALLVREGAYTPRLGLQVAV